MPSSGSDSTYPNGPVFRNHLVFSKRRSPVPCSARLVMAPRRRFQSQRCSLSRTRRPEVTQAPTSTTGTGPCASAKCCNRTPCPDDEEDVPRKPPPADSRSVVTPSAQPPTVGDLAHSASRERVDTSHGSLEPTVHVSIHDVSGLGISYRGCDQRRPRWAIGLEEYSNSQRALTVRRHDPAPERRSAQVRVAIPPQKLLEQQSSPPSRWTGPIFTRIENGVDTVSLYVGIDHEQTEAENPEQLEGLPPPFPKGRVPDRYADVDLRRHGKRFDRLQ